MSDSQKHEVRDDFAAQAQGRSTNIVGELFAFLKQSKKWWLAPILVALLLLGLLIVLSGSIAAPFVYTLF